MADNKAKQTDSDMVYPVVTSYSYSNALEIKAFGTHDEAEQYIQGKVIDEIRIANENKEIPTEHIDVKSDNDWYPNQTDLTEYTWDDFGNPVKDVITWRIVEMPRKELLPE